MLFALITFILGIIVGILIVAIVFILHNKFHVTIGEGLDSLENISKPNKGKAYIAGLSDEDQSLADYYNNQKKDVQII